MAKSSELLVVACLCSATLANAQTASPVPPPAPAQPTLTPGAAYKQAMHPLDVVRSSMSNWSDSELGAFAVGMRIAKKACAESPPGKLFGRRPVRLGAAMFAWARLGFGKHGGHALSRQ
jgi:hypothetical protein